MRGVRVMVGKDRARKTVNANRRHERIDQFVSTHSGFSCGAFFVRFAVVGRRYRRSLSPVAIEMQNGGRCQQNPTGG